MGMLCLLCWAIATAVSAQEIAARQAGTSVWTTQRAAADFDRHGLHAAKMAARVQQTRSLAGSIGWVEYDFSVPASDWYEVFILGSGGDSEFFLASHAPNARPHYVAGSQGFDGKTDKLGNFFLERGKHSLRMQRHYWTGFPAITGFSVRASNGSPATSTRVILQGERTVFRTGECPQLEVRYGPRQQDAVLPLHVVDAASSVTLATQKIELPAVSKVTTISRTIPCNSEGRFVLYFHDGGKTLSNRDVHPITYEVFDTRARAAPTAAPRKTLVQTIDCAATLPSYASGITHVVQKPFGDYRESDDTSWLDPQPVPFLSREPSWFAYALAGVQPQRLHLVEIDYPDDTVRSFAIALRESAPLSYPVAGGVDSGGEFLVSQSMQTHSLLFWPRAANPRIVFLPARNGTRAAAARIRVYRIEDGLPPLIPAVSNGRHFVNWYEEGSNFLSMYGAPDEGPGGETVALKRWASTAAHMGIDTLMPTAVIYSFALYPSRYHITFSRPWSPDTLRKLLLVAEAHKLRVIPELHPRADELGRLFPEAGGPKPNLSVSREGKTVKDVPPLFSPLHPSNQEWYLGAIEELAKNYADSPALAGISLRMMQWKNPGLHNFHSLDWGYDDYTINLFEKETGLRVAGGDQGPGRFAARQQWLMARARERWIAWRCEKIADLIRLARDRVHAARADLEIHIPVFPMTEAGGAYHSGTQWLREAGIDPALISKIDGVKLVNGLHAYGRRFSSRTADLLRSNLTTPRAQRAVTPAGSSARHLPYAMYFEATEKVVSPEALGFASNTKKTWMSAVVNPAGRNYLERFAVLLADTDAIQLGDGGNAYTIGQPELREFLNEFRYLPATPFALRTAGAHAVVVRELKQDQRFLFYAVNRSSRESQVILRLKGSGEVASLATGKVLFSENGNLRLTLKPFQLRAFRAPPSLSIDDVVGR